MIGHQREVLASLGIDLWVPDFLPSQQNVATSIWRDQSTTEIISEIMRPQSQPEAKSIPEHPPAQHKLPHPVPPAEIATQPVEQKVDTALKEEIVREVIHVEAFQLQAVALEHCALVIEATQLSGAATTVAKYCASLTCAKVCAELAFSFVEFARWARCPELYSRFL